MSFGYFVHSSGRLERQKNPVGFKKN